MKKPIEIKRYFEEKYLKHSCFDSLEELLRDKTTIQINTPRALIAVELMGVWRGLNDEYKRIATLEDVLKRYKLYDFKASETTEQYVNRMRKTLSGVVFREWLSQQLKEAKSEPEVPIPPIDRNNESRMHRNQRGFGKEAKGE